MTKIKFYLQSIYFMIMGLVILDIIKNDLAIGNYHSAFISFLKLIILTVIIIPLIDIFTSYITKKLSKNKS